VENRRYYYKMSLVREMENHVSCRVLENEPMSQHTTFRVGGPARYFVYISNTVELVKILELATANNLPLFVLGSGSNLLVSDSGYDGIVVVLDGDFREIAIKEKNIVAGAGVSLLRLSGKRLKQDVLALNLLLEYPERSVALSVVMQVVAGVIFLVVWSP